MVVRSRSRKSLRGLTSFELGLAVAFAAVLGLTARFVFGPVSRQNEADTARRTAATIQKAALDWRAENPEGCPTLSVLLHERRLARDAALDDPWGSRYRVRCQERNVSVVSPGRDRRQGTDDDVHYPRS